MPRKSKNTHNSYGEEYARYGQLTEGDVIHMDDCFGSCGIANTDLTVCCDDAGLFVPCEEGRHYIEANIVTDKGHLIGITKVEAQNVG